MTPAQDDTLPSVRYLEIKQQDAGQRVDNFLQRHLKGVPKSHIYRILRSGEVRVNKGRVKPAYRLVTGDSVRIPPVRVGIEKVTRVPQTLLAELEAAVVFEDDQLIALNKPPGLAVHGGSGVPFGVIEALRQARPNAPMLELVHRLDKDTSGILLIAKTRALLNALHELLRDGQVDKQYLALLAGRWQGGERKLSVALQRGSGKGSTPKMSVSEDGKSAETLFMPLQTFANASLMAVTLGTGRTHQIRVHAEYLGQPLAGDDKYGDFAFNREMKKFGLRRQFLHATRIRFTMPESGQRYDIEAPLAADLQAVLERLES